MSDGNARPWEQIRLKELGELSTSSVDKKVEPSERRVSLINYMDVYRNDFIEPSMSLMPVTASASEIDRFQIKKDDVLFTPSSETPDDIGHAALVLEDMPHTLHSYHTVRFRQFAPPRVQGRFAGHIFKQRGFREYVARNSTGSTRYTLSLGEFERAVISVPPAEEQVYIAQILDTLDTQIHQTEVLIGKLERIKQGILNDLLTRGIDQNGQLRPTPNQAPDLYKNSSLGWIPKEWQVLPFLEVAGLPSGQVSPLAAEYREMALVAPDHIEPRTGKLIRIETAHAQGAISGKYLFEPGDIIYSKIRPYLRKAWLADMKGLCSADMYPLRPKSGISSMFLFTVVMGEHFSEFANAVSMRTGIPKINRKELASFEVALPCSLEQAAIENTLTAIDKRIQDERKELVKLTSQKRGLMDDLLTGQVRVTPLLETKEWATA